MSLHTLVSSATLAKHLTDSEWRVFDCRFSLADAQAGRQAYRRGHIPGAIYVDLNQDLSAEIRRYTGRHPLPDFRVLAEKLGYWGVNSRVQVVVYDDAGGAFAGRMWWLLRILGHSDVAVLDGGFPAWQKQGQPITTALPTPKATTFRAYPDNCQWLTAAQIENGLARNTIRLLDARATERFIGHVEPIDPVAGHVPKAINRPLQANLTQAGLSKTARQLRDEFEQLIAPFPAEQIVHMCGSGVTACLNILAMEYAGLRGSRLYAGSWSEWIRDANRPVAQG